MTRAADAALAVRTLALSLRAQRVLRRGGLPGALREFDLAPVEAGTPLPGGRPWSQHARHVTRVAGAVLGRPPARATCLPTALTFAQVLRGAGIPADVVIGVSTADGFSAHAWVELPEGRLDPAGHPLTAHREMVRLRRPVCSTSP